MSVTHLLDGFSLIDTCVAGYGVGYAWSPSTVTVSIGDTVRWDWNAPTFQRVGYRVFSVSSPAGTTYEGGPFKSGDTKTETGEEKLQRCLAACPCFKTTVFTRPPHTLCTANGRILCSTGHIAGHHHFHRLDNLVYCCCFILTKENYYFAEKKEIVKCT